MGTKKILRRWLGGRLRSLALILKVCWIFFPGILIVSVTGLFLTQLILGKDIILILLESESRGLFFMTGLVFWSTVTWYSSRLIAYNQDRLFEQYPTGLFHGPRILGFACFTAVLTAMLAIPPVNLNGNGLWAWLLLQTVIYFSSARFFSRLRDRSPEERLRKIRYLIIIASTFLFTIAAWRNDIVTYLITLPLLQVTGLFLVMVRRKLREAAIVGHEPTRKEEELMQKSRSYHWLAWILDNPVESRGLQRNKRILQGEITIFRTFNIIAGISLFIYGTAIFNLNTARFISTLPIALLSLAVMLGIGNLISLFSMKKGINFHFLFILATMLVGSLFEPHDVRRIVNKTPDKGNQYAKRPKLGSHFAAWTKARKEKLEDTSVREYPVIFALADGGASRSGYWTAGVWSKLEDETKGRFSRHLFCLSGASGGSVGNTIFFTSMLEGRSKDQPFGNRARSRHFLSQDFLSYTLARLLGPDLLKPLFPVDAIYDRAAALEYTLEHIPGGNELGRRMAEPFSSVCLAKTGTEPDLPLLFINTTRMQDGRPAVVSTLKLETAIHGKRIDVLDSLRSWEDIRLSTAVVLGARFPYISPAGRIDRNYYVDGGYFDNSGAGVVHETLIELQRIINDSLKSNPRHTWGKLRFYVIHATNSPQYEPPVERVHPVINDLFAPVKTLLGSYSTQTHVNNLRLMRYLQGINHGDTTFIPIHLYEPEEQERYPMNWVISKDNLQKMEQRLETHTALNSLVRALNAGDEVSLKGVYPK